MMIGSSCNLHRMKIVRVTAALSVAIVVKEF